MPTVDLGKVGMSLKGVYDNEAQYEKLDVVYYDDSTYCAKVSTKGNTPSKEDDTYWQLLVAPNPLATWKPNTKDDEGYVQKGDGNADSLWATDSQGNPAWVKKDDVATKVNKNSYSNDGIVTKGSGNYDKAWATDSSGAPAWREYFKTTPVYSMNLSEFKHKVTYPAANCDNYLFLFAEVLIPPRSTSYFNDFKYLTFDMSDSLLFDKGTNKIICEFMYDGDTATMSLLHTNNTSPHYPKVWVMFKGNDVYQGRQRFYLGISYYADSYIYIHNVQKSDSTIGVNFRQYLSEESNYIYVPRSQQDTSYEYYNMHIKASTFYSPISDVAKDTSGIVPAPTSSNANKVFGTDSSGNPSWRELDSLTSTEIQEAISTAIAEADFSSFEIVETKPTPETAVENKFYLVKNEDTEHYDIYAKIGEKVEWIDDTTVDLTDYATKEELPTNVSELANDANYTSLTDEQYNTLLQLLGEE